ncbi:hypothetical protein HYG81_24315 (plasmid) [Natrinema zhouii]|uniref:hypothetical protein n=1 Tax=Natrinema zhouii TaxID=1710539 RepID=UPI001CFFB81A|nr:hypothetical protein [Natrinema zhouii]UHQ98895.1 hypothetical protein HYG81_24315 [Natrinema zhouii]
MSDDKSARIASVSSRNQLSPEDPTHFDAIEESRGGVRGPFQVLLRSPEMTGRTGELGAYLRTKASSTGPIGDSRF